MEKIIKVGEKDVKFKSTGATALRYSAQFGGDLIGTMMDMMNRAGKGETLRGSDIDVLTKAAYIMAKQAGDEAASFEEWLDQFEMFDMLGALNDIMTLWTQNMTATIQSKKK